MSFSSFNSFAEALRRVYPCKPRLLLYNGSLTVHSNNNKSDNIVGESKTVAETTRRMRSIQFIPLVTKPSYYCKEEKKDLLVNFTEKYGYSTTLFLMGRFPHYMHSYASSKSSRDNNNNNNGSSQLCLRKEILDDMINPKISTFNDIQTPTINLQLVRCESRVNLTNCTRTRMLQDELRRTEDERWLLYQSIEKSSSLGVDAESRKLEGSLFSQSPHTLHLVWNKHGWYFEDPLLMELQSTEVPHFSNSTGYWQAWLKPFYFPLNGCMAFPLQDVQHFHLKEDVTVINTEEKDRYNAEGREIVFSWQYYRKAVAPNYWAYNGEPVHPNNYDLHYTVEIEDEEEDNSKLLSMKDKCWFTLSELSQRQLEIRRGGNIFQMPVYYDGCGFFLHEAPHWFFLPREEVLRRCPLTKHTVKNIPFVSESGNVSDVMAAVNNDGPLRGELVFVLKETQDWYSYPRKYGVLNFNLNDLQTLNGNYNNTTDSSSIITEPLIFIEFSAAVSLMQDWSKTHQYELSKDNEISKEEHPQSLLEFFATLPSMVSTAVFINTFITHCSSPVTLTSFTIPTMTNKEKKETTNITTTTLSCSESTLYTPCTEEYDTSNKSSENKSTRSLLNLEKTEDSRVDFPAVDRRVYTPGHRLNKAYTHPQEDHPQHPSAIECTHLTPAVAAGIIETRKNQKRSTMTANSDETSPSINEEETRNDSDIKENTVWDLGITWLSFRYSISAVNALDAAIRK